MKKYCVLVTPDAKADLKKYLGYLQSRKKNPQAVNRAEVKNIFLLQGIKNILDSSRMLSFSAICLDGYCLKRMDF